MASHTIERYESLLQLAVALNFAYGSLEPILQERLAAVLSRNEEIASTVAGSRDISALRGRVSLADFNKFRARLCAVRDGFDLFRRFNVWMSLLCAVISLVWLYVASVAENGFVKTERDGILLLASCYGWLLVAVCYQAAARVYLSRFVEPLLLKEDR